MTNRECLRLKNNKELARLINKNDSCDFCIRSINGDCESERCVESEYCEEGIEEWLEQGHIESMPNLNIGDILTSNMNRDFIVVAEGYVFNVTDEQVSSIVNYYLRNKDNWSREEKCDFLLFQFPVEIIYEWDATKSKEETT